MYNITTKTKGSILTIEVDLSKRGKLSASGKSIQVASTGGNVLIEGTENVKMGLNIYVPAAEE